ncbi:hypothetical protein PI124_g15585 [Phytophthora idaei]|nr:hypothetical protein PI125_g15584 [Phytophthora idaei]KAG3143545.1 hypothetical protein PI126_g14573 [Phytophthora idaei]KAG3239478.1 hypothetical protein PI124_g15585 [Phytophthora idaei]
MKSSVTTKFPIVFIHGVFGFGKTRPMWNRWSPYWPEEGINELNENHIVLHVGPLTSNHDRACEAFYQLKLTTANSTVERPDMDAMVYVRITLPERFGTTTLVSCTDLFTRIAQECEQCEGDSVSKNLSDIVRTREQHGFSSKAKPRESSQRVKEQVATGEEEFGSILLVGLL